MKLILKTILITLCVINVSLSVYAQSETEFMPYSGDGNYTVGVTVNVTPRSGESAGIVFRQQNETLYNEAYYMALITNVNFKLRKRGRYGYYDIYTRDIGAAGIHDISVSAEGNKITVYLDGEEEYTFEDYGYIGESYIEHPLLSGGAGTYVSTSDGTTSCYGFYLTPMVREKNYIIDDIYMYDENGNEIENFVPGTDGSITVDAVLKEPVNADMIFGVYTPEGYIGGDVVSIKDESFVSANFPAPADWKYAYINAYTWTDVSELKPLFDKQTIGEINNYIREETIDEKIIEPDFSEPVFAHSNSELEVVVGNGSDNTTSGIVIDTGLSKSELYGKDLYICAVQDGVLYMYHEHDGKKQLVGEKILPKSAEGEYNMTVKFRGADICVSIDGIRYLTYTARNLFYINGMVGKYIDGEGAFVRDLKVK